MQEEVLIRWLSGETCVLRVAFARVPVGGCQARGMFSGSCGAVSVQRTQSDERHVLIDEQQYEADELRSCHGQRPKLAPIAGAWILWFRNEDQPLSLNTAINLVCRTTLSVDPRIRQSVSPARLDVPRPLVARSSERMLTHGSRVEELDRATSSSRWLLMSWRPGLARGGASYAGTCLVGHRRASCPILAPKVRARHGHGIVQSQSWRALSAFPGFARYNHFIPSPGVNIVEGCRLRLGSGPTAPLTPMSEAAPNPGFSVE